MEDLVIESLNHIHPVTDELRKYLQHNLKTIHLKRKNQYHTAGEVCNKIAFVMKGVLRSYYFNSEGHDTSGWFMKEGDVIVSVKSFFCQTPSNEHIEALEDAILLYVTYDELQLMYNRFPEFNIIGRILLEKYYVQSEDRLSGIRNLRAKDRYQYLLQNHPDLLLRIPAKYLATYLGIDKATFSRLKATLKI